MVYRVEGNIVDIRGRELFQGSVCVENGFITKIERHPTDKMSYILPGFINAHVHIESSMLTPENFGYLVAQQGTVAVISDPHEIANVMGQAGIDFMIENSQQSPIKTFFTIPSCVPATPFDVSGGIITAADVKQMAASGKFVGLSEVMNIPGVIHGEPEVIQKIEAAKQYGLPIDGHAPLLRGETLAKYASHNISTDHECSSIEEANEKLELGMKILIREGSAARNYEALKSLIGTDPNNVMFCTDDSHPHEIIDEGHIRKLVVRAIADGFNLFDVLQVASINAINHYHLNVGQLRVGDKADFIVTSNLTTFDIEQVYIDGVLQQIRDHKKRMVPLINQFNHSKICPSSLKKEVKESIDILTILDGELTTTKGCYTPTQATENLEADIEANIAKIVYLNRYTNGQPQVAFCKGFNLKQGAFASSVSHDSHNILAVGCSDKELAEAINTIIEHKGGIAVCCDGKSHVLPLPIGGIMSDACGEEVAEEYKQIEAAIKETGCTVEAPLMTLSFMSLVVIPAVKIGEKGLFCYDNFNWISQ